MATRPPPTSGICISDHTPVGWSGFLGATQTTSPGDSTSVTALGAPRLPVLAHLTSSKGISTASRSAARLPSGCRAGRRPTTALAFCASSTTPSRQGCRSVGISMPLSATPQSPRDLDALQGAAPALVAVEGDKAVDQRLARQALQVGIERGADGQAAVDAAVAGAGALGAAVEPVLAELVGQRAPHFLGEVVGRIDLRAERADVDLERLGLGGLRLLRRDVAVLGHLVDDPVAPDRGFLGLAEGMIVVGRLGQRGEIGGLLDRQVRQLLAEVVEGGGGDAIGAHAEIDLVEIELEDPVLRSRRARCGWRGSPPSACARACGRSTAGSSWPPAG